VDVEVGDGHAPEKRAGDKSVLGDVFSNELLGLGVNLQTTFMMVRPSPSTMRFMTDIDERLDAHSYPATADELIDAHGDLELALPNGSETFGDALARVESSTFESPEEARLTAYSAVGEAAIGRKHYSDRDPTALGVEGHEQVSL
jgi:hypothetical protein